MMATVRVRKQLSSIRVRVWGWSDEDAKRHPNTLSRIVKFVEKAYWLGLSTEDIEDDIIDKFSLNFEDGAVEIDSDNIVQVTLVPITV